jgi:hypothetical protein
MRKGFLVRSMIFLPMILLLSLSVMSALLEQRNATKNDSNAKVLRVMANNPPCGTWEVTSSPGMDTVGSNLTVITSLPSNGLLALGSLNNELYSILWKDGVWSRFSIASQNVYINDITVVTSDNIWAVGTATDVSNRESTFIARWDGTKWSVIPSPNIGVTNNNLLGVSAISADNIWAVGTYRDHAWKGKPLILHWDGNEWRQDQSPSLSSLNNRYSELTDVIALSSTDVWAVGGEQIDDIPNLKPLTLHWDGHSWHHTPVPDISGYSGLRAAVAMSADNIWAVGNNAVTIHWNGKDWRNVPNPHTGSTRVHLSGVAANSGGEVWAIGTEWLAWPIILHWDGSRWSSMDSPWALSSRDLNPYINLTDVTLTSNNELWVVGGTAFAEEVSDRPMYSIAARFIGSPCPGTLTQYP